MKLNTNKNFLVEGRNEIRANINVVFYFIQSTIVKCSIYTIKQFNKNEKSFNCLIEVALHLAPHSRSYPTVIETSLKREGQSHRVIYMFTVRGAIVWITETHPIEPIPLYNRIFRASSFRLLVLLQYQCHFLIQHQVFAKKLPGHQLKKWVMRNLI